MTPSCCRLCFPLCVVADRGARANEGKREKNDNVTLEKSEPFTGGKICLLRKTLSFSIIHDDEWLENLRGWRQQKEAFTGACCAAPRVLLGQCSRIIGWGWPISDKKVNFYIDDNESDVWVTWKRPRKTTAKEESVHELRGGGWGVGLKSIAPAARNNGKPWWTLVLLFSHLAARVLGCWCFIQTTSTQAVRTISKRKAWTYCGQLVERLGIGIRTQVAVHVWAQEGRESNQAVVGQGAAGLQGSETGAGGLKMRMSPRQTPKASILQPGGTSRSSTPPGAFLWEA